MAGVQENQADINLVIRRQLHRKCLIVATPLNTLIYPFFQVLWVFWSHLTSGNSKKAQITKKYFQKRKTMTGYMRHVTGCRSDTGNFLVPKRHKYTFKVTKTVRKKPVRSGSGFRVYIRPGASLILIKILSIPVSHKRSHKDTNRRTADLTVTIRI